MKPVATDKPTRHYLVNVYGWTLIYETHDSGPDWNTVTIRRKYRGMEVSELTMTRDEARSHWQTQTRNGFVVPNKF